MRVLLTHERFLPDFGGGGEYIVANIAANLRRRGVDVSVLTTGDPELTTYDGVPTIRLPIGRHRFNFAAGRIAELARGADLIQTFNYQACFPSFLAARRTGVPVICSVLALFRDTWLEMKGHVVGAAIRAWERYLMTRPYARIVFMSEYNLNGAIELGVDPKRALVIDPAIDVEEYDPDPAKQNIALFAGKLERRKGIGDVLAAARALPQVPFQVLGWGPDEAAVRAGAPPNVEFLGFRTGDELRRFYERARIFVLPSRAEGFPLALIAGMAAGCAIVGTLPLPFEGARVPPGDKAKLIEAIRGLWQSPAEAERLGRLNRERAARYNWRRYTDELLALYTDVLSGRSGAGCAPRFRRG